MACSKYTLTNTGNTVVNFSYRRCDDSMWEYQVELAPNETKNIWLVNGTYSSGFGNIVLQNQGVFPPIYATPTPTATPGVTPTPSTTPGVTPTQTTTTTNTPTVTSTSSSTPTPTPTVTQTTTQTPTVTSTNTSTPTPTVTTTVTPTHTRFAFLTYLGNTDQEACISTSGLTIYGDVSLFDNNTQFYSDPVLNDWSVGGVPYFSYGGQVVNIVGFGTYGDPGVFTSCVAVPTPTQTVTQTQTPTPTITNTPSPTPTFGFYTYTLGTGGTANDACIDFGSAPNTIYGTVAGGPGPNVGESLFFDSGLTVAVADGYYSNGTAWYQVTGGAGLITSADPSGC